MYLLDSESLNKLLGGEFYQVIVARQAEPDISVRKLYNFQFNYFSYQGFRKFYRRYLEPIVDAIRIIDDNSILAKILRWLTHGKDK